MQTSLGNFDASNFFCCLFSFDFMHFKRFENYFVWRVVIFNVAKIKAIEIENREPSFAA